MAIISVKNGFAAFAYIIAPLFVTLFGGKKAMKAKKTKVPVKGYVFEYIKAKYGYNEAEGLILPKTLSAYHAVHADTVQGWWKNMEGKQQIVLVCPYTSKRHLYYVAKFLESVFKYHFLVFMEAKTDAAKKNVSKSKRKATDAIKEFCTLYGITETSWPLNSAKTEWTRHNRLKRESGFFAL